MLYAYLSTVEGSTEEGMGMGMEEGMAYSKALVGMDVDSMGRDHSSSL
jgi:hypothetical protein